MTALAESFGRGAMTNHWIDLQNSDCVLVMGANPASNHPVAFKWIIRARERGATLICVDPRFSRTAALADIYAPLRPGTDLAFLGGMINYILSNNKYFKEYVAQYTNASYLLGPEYSFHDGLFSGYDEGRRRYDRSSWAFVRDGSGLIRQDLNLADPACVFQRLIRHYSRYTPEAVSAVTGTPVADLLKVYQAFSATGAPDRSGTILYAMGQTQHTVGSQNIRAMTIVQLLLGNVGLPGGGINALRGEGNVQGSTDHGLLYNSWPGYLAAPTADLAGLEDYLKRQTPQSAHPLSANWWRNKPRYLVSLLKALFGEAARPENGFSYSWLPKLDPERSYSWLDIFGRLAEGEIRGLLAWGQNPACSGADAGQVRRALGKLDWLVSVNLFDNETASFWRGPGQDTKGIKTEVFLLPACAWLEKEGSVTNSGRWMQWRDQALTPPGQGRPDGQITLDLFLKLRELYRRQGGPNPEPILNLRLDYLPEGKFRPQAVAGMINGRFEADTTINGKNYQKGDLVPNFSFLRDDGATSCGDWLYSGSFTPAGNLAARRGREDPTGLGLFPDWAWSWPLNRRILYNRAAVDLSGKPWSERKKVIEWAPGQGWLGDVADGGYPPLGQGPAGRRPFIMKPDGLAAIFGPGLADGPFPEHYEPFESPVEKNLFSSTRMSPVARLPQTWAGQLFDLTVRFPVVATTHRLAEHWQTGVMTRRQAWLLETQPQLFVEMDEVLAAQRGIRNGDLCLVSSARGEVMAWAMVTSRLKPLTVQGRLVHQVSLPWCFGWLHPRDGGDSANLLTSQAADPNALIPETKAFLVQITRRTRGDAGGR